ncbi:hypothetical protein TWF102_007580 [Orbilia oligospora]|uniref:Uncharacterized protein n=1 Tax=Orbilia oligospora TaxID=2813651 RepID=A0A7C8NAD8_ORBOL|nr:hypothetical protein TWF102_007580 [Orbilia oligospora]
MAPPATPRHRFPSPDDVPRPRTDPQLPPRISTGTVQTSITAPALAPRPQFATPGPPAARRRQQQQQQQQQPTQSIIQTPGGWNNRQYSRGFSPDPDFFTSSVGQRKDGVVRTVPRTLGSSSNKRRRRSFDLDEIDEALLVSSGKPRVLGDSSGGWKVPVEYFGGTPVPQRIQGLLHHHATPTPSLRRPTFRQGSAVISSPPGDLNLSFGDTQEDVQDDDDEDDNDYSGRGKIVMTAAVVNGGGGDVPQKKRQKSAGVFDDIESIASSLPGTRDEGTEGVEGSNRKENSRSTITTITSHNTTTKSGLRTPQRVLKSGGISNIHDSGSTIPPPPSTKTITTTTAVVLGEQWMAVPDQPQLKLPAKTSPTEKLNKAICAMAWSPSHRKRRNVNNKYLNGGLAATVLGWAYDAQDVVLRSNMVIEQNQKEKQSLNLKGRGGGGGRIGNSYAGGDRAGMMVVKVGSVWGEEGYAAITGEEEDEEIESGAERKVILIGDENSGLRKDLRQGSWVEVRMPMWEVTVEGGKWTVGINWRLL